MSVDLKDMAPSTVAPGDLIVVRRNNETVALVDPVDVAAMGTGESVASDFSALPGGLSFPRLYAHVIPTPADSSAMHARLLHLGTGQDVVVWRNAPSHYSTDGSTLMAMTTRDDGVTTYNARVIYRDSDPTYEAGQFIAAHCGARSVAFSCVRRVTDTDTFYKAPVMVTATNPASGAWAAVEMPRDADLHPQFEALFTGDVYRWPAAAGGHDTLGFVAFCYSQGQVGVVSTTDAWATTPTIYRAIPSVAGKAWTECGLIGSPATGYALLIRETVDTGNKFLWVSFADNPTGPWSTPIITTLENPGGPPDTVMLDDDTAYLLMRSANNAQLSDIHASALLVAEIDVATFIATSGAGGVGAFKPLAVLGDWASGYVHPVRRGDGWVFLTSGAESNKADFPNNTHGGTSSIVALSTLPVPVATMAAAQGLALTADNNALANGDLQSWWGAIYSEPAGRETAAVGWRIGRVSGGGAGHYWARAAGQAMPYALEFGRILGEVETAAVNALTVLQGEDLAPYLGKSVTLTFGASGGATRTGTLFMLVNSRDAVGLIDSTDGSMPGSATLVNNFNCFPLTLPAGEVQTHHVSFRVPVDAAQMVVRFVKANTGTAGASDFVRIEGLTLHASSAVPVHPKPRSPAQSAAACSRWRFQTFRGTPAADANPRRIVAAGATTHVSVDWPEQVGLPVGRVFSPVTGTVGKARNVTTGADVDATFVTIGALGGTIEITGVTTGDVLTFHASATSEPWT